MAAARSVAVAQPAELRPALLHPPPQGRGLRPALPSENIRAALARGIDRLVALQQPDGAWRGEYGGPMFLLPMYVAALRVTEREPPPDLRRGMIAYLRGAQNADGGVGLHEEDAGSMFATVLVYVALRILGVPRDDPALVRMRAWIRANGTALGAASWGKLLLAVLNLYPYEGLPPILPELWLLPRAAPFHPGRLWCHARMVYLPMAWLYGTRSRIPEDDLVRELRADLFDRPWSEIDFPRFRHHTAPSDARFPATPEYRAAMAVLGAYDRRAPAALRRRALDEIVRQIRYEDRATHDIDLGPVNSVLNAIVHHFRAPGSEEARRSFAALDAYLEETPRGIHFNGYNSTALWDTVFATRAILAAPDPGRWAETLRRAHRFVRANQVREDPPDHERHYRHAARGGWPFSDLAHGWPVADCTAEGFRCAVALEEFADEPLEEDRLRDAVNLLLSMQNDDGGWASYERRRAGDWLERFNPSQVFADIMVEHSYPECTSSCVQALALARVRLPDFRAGEVERALRRGVRFLRRSQRADGGWVGSWGVCFTYAGWFAVTGLTAAGVPSDAPEVRRGIGFLLQRQNHDGGWGEHAASCLERRYVRDTESRVVQTAWCLLALCRADLGNTAAARRAAAFLLDRQQPDGDWPPEPMVGLFNRSVLIRYDNYRRYFPVWALAEFAAANDRRTDG